MFLFILSKITLLISPSSFFAGLISLTVGLFWKFFLWSFSDMKQLFSPFACILFKTLLLHKTCFPAASTFFLMLLLAFLYVAVLRRLVSFHILLLLGGRCLLFYLQMLLFYLMLSFFLSLASIDLIAVKAHSGKLRYF